MTILDDELAKIPERVAAGAAWLDQTEGAGNWEHRVDLAALDLSDSCRCVLGQIFSDRARSEILQSGFGYAMSIVQASTYVWPADRAFISDAQLPVEDTGAYYEALDEAWIS